MTAPVIQQLTCLRCGASWYPASPEPPKRCAKCRSPYWNTPKREKEAQQ